MTEEQRLEGLLNESYDYIQRVFERQKRVIPFDLIYGDGTIHKPLSRETVKVIYDEMVAYLEGEQRGTK